MNNILNKVTFRLIIGQILPGIFLYFTFKLFIDSISSTSGINLFHNKLWDLWHWYSTSLSVIGSTRSILTLLIEGVVLGLFLQTTSMLAAANRESFRNKKFDEAHHWVQKDSSDIRKRSWVRQKIAELWKNRSLLVLLPLAPLILVFDFISILVAKPRDLYKEIYIVRSHTEKLESLASVISDYEYAAEYFGNMALAILAHLVVVIIFLDLSAIASISYVIVVYVLASIHYISFRTLQTSIDKAIQVTFCDVE